MRIARPAIVLASVAVVVGGVGLAVTMDEPDRPIEKADPPDIVLILLDDFSTELVQYMDATERLSATSVNFDNYFTSNPLCCPSRASILTGRYPHNTGVHDNRWPDGGISAFLANGQENDTIGVHLKAAGYRTGFIGKFLNGYRPSGGGGESAAEPIHPPNYVPPGWDEWFATGDAYQSFDYVMVSSIDGAAQSVPASGGMVENYATDVMATRAEQFVEENSAEPFVLMINPFATHNNGGPRLDPDTISPPRFPPAPRDRAESAGRPAEWGPPEYPAGDCGLPGGGCSRVAFPDPTWAGQFNAKPQQPPDWYDDVVPASPSEVAGLARLHTERIQMAQSADDLVERVVAALDAADVLDTSYVMVTSDNGYHLGQHGLGEGKSTAYDHDVRLPLIVRTPTSSTESRTPYVVQNVDFLPTFLELAGGPVPAGVDGRSFAPILTGEESASAGSRAALVEFWRDESLVAGDDNPDRERALANIPPDYHALRTTTYLYVDYSLLDAVPPASGAAEYYDLREDPNQMHNLYPELSAAQRTQLNVSLAAYGSCAGEECLNAGATAPVER